jgi:histidine triad (HIT) family protein
LSPTDCLFCRLVAGEIQATVVRSDERTLAFRDINPQAPIHVLVVPREHVSSLDEVRDDQGDLLGALFLAARDVARQEGLAEDGYRTVLNVGADGGQTVPHVHVHVLGGRPMRWPPG